MQKFKVDSLYLTTMNRTLQESIIVSWKRKFEEEDKEEWKREDGPCFL